MRHDLWAGPDRGAGRAAFPSVPWKAADVAIGVVVVAFSVFLVAIIYGAIDLAIDSDPSPGLTFTIIGGAGYGIVVFASWIMGPVRNGASLESLGIRLPSPVGYGQLLLPLLVVAASLAIVSLYVGVVSLLGMDIPQSLPDDIGLEGPAIIGSFALVVLWGPLAEEVFFRGFIFPGLMGRLGFAGAAVVSSLLFALAHVDGVERLVMVPPIFAIGMLLAWLYQRTGSIWSCFAAHAIWNAIGFSIFAWL